jgi:type III pantothenate kinase
MTWLLFDAGNSALKWKFAEPHSGAPEAQRLSAGNILSQPRAAAQDEADDFVAALVGQWDALRRIDAAFGCSVADESVARMVDAALRRRFGLAATWLGSQSQFEANGVRLRSGYRDPRQLGADRWHAMLAARAAWPDVPLVVVNAGTATTVDCVRADGFFVGGVIAPGVRVMFDSLARRTARLPLADGGFAAHPDNTDDAIATGVLDCQLGLIERRVRNFAADAAEPVRVLVDGGNAQALRARLAFDASCATVVAERDLVLRGVLLRAQALMGKRGPQMSQGS